MKLKVLGSGSSGNCYILENDTEALIIEAGVPFKDVKVALDFNIKKIRAVIITHDHGDHRKYWYEYVRAGIPVFEPFKNDGQTLEFNNSKFLIQAFPNQSKDGTWAHNNSDGSECPCYGFFIYHPEMGNLVYVTDTEYVRWVFHKCSHILVEANYSDDLIDNKADNREHVLRGHMSLKTATEFISTNDNPTLLNVVLIHLSDKNADSAQFQQKIKETVKYGANVYVAEKGLEVGLNLCPF